MFRVILVKQWVVMLVIMYYLFIDFELLFCQGELVWSDNEQVFLLLIRVCVIFLIIFVRFYEILGVILVIFYNRFFCKFRVEIFLLYIMFLFIVGYIDFKILYNCVLYLY